MSTTTNNSDMPVTFDRRASDPENVNNITRIAVLEKIAESHENRISDIEEFHKSVVERFDQKIQLDATNQVIMEKTLTRAVISIDGLSENLKSAFTVASEANKLATKHETIGQTVIKICSIAVIIVGALWSVFTFMNGSH